MQNLMHLTKKNIFTAALQEHRISRQFSTDSMSSVNSCSSACSGNSGKSGDALSDKKKKKKGWVCIAFLQVLEQKTMYQILILLDFLKAHKFSI